MSGQFHLIAGILHLFGFRLPETHHLYYLASSFTDFWRRINIYWKDFMMKLVYYPSYFSLRRRGGNVALIGATVMVFLSTWLLHSYQWFWLRGGFPVAAQDALFWGVLGALVVFGSLREAKRPRHRTVRRASAWSALLALRTIVTFTTICVLWSLWSADSPMAWVTMWIAAGNVGPGDIGLLIGLILAGLLVAGRARSVREANDATARPFYRWSAVYSTAVLLGLLVAGHPSLYAWSGSRLTSTIASLQHSTLNARDAALRQKGYYENLDNVTRMSTQLWEIQAQRPKHWAGGLSATDAYHERRDFMRYDLKPDTKTVLHDQPLTVNQWGMRGRGYSLAKPAGTYRIAVLGPSHVMGSGVADGETFTEFLEAELNRTARAPNRRYEVLNFGVAGFSLLQQLAMLEDRVLAFQPDAVFVTDSPRLTAPVVAHLVHVVWDRVPIPFPGLEALVRQTGVPALAADGIPVPFENVRAVLGKLGVKSRMPWREADRRLRLATDGLVRWTLQRIADVAREHAAVPVFLALDIVVDEPVLEMRALRDASDAGYLVFNLLNCWVHRDKPLLRIARWDDHPNAAGNRVIAETLVAMMHQHRAELRLGTATADIVVEERR